MGIWKSIEQRESSEGNVWKYVFIKDDAIAEAVLYRYESFEERTVMCVSVQSGCPVGCKFCGTGNHFVRNLTAHEITSQVWHMIRLKEIDPSRVKKMQVMFMSMGEPMLNWDNVEAAIDTLVNDFEYTNAQYLISTIGVKDEATLMKIGIASKANPRIGLQFSIHKSNDVQRNKLIPYENKMTLDEIARYGELWHSNTSRPVYLNYCIDGTNNTEDDFKNLSRRFRPEVFNLTFSVICSKNESVKAAAYRNLDVINAFSQKFLEAGYNVRVFNPAGQDDIGGGCGQLFAVQSWFKTHQHENEFHMHRGEA
jgi:23S rRNA (adenine2503-C2)-methyltransferase